MRKTHFYRVSGCVNKNGEPTCVGMHFPRRDELLQFAYGEVSTLNAAVRLASRELREMYKKNPQTASALVTRSWSQSVVTRAHAKLTGAYSPARAAELKRIQDEAAALAADNNAAWEQVAA